MSVTTPNTDVERDAEEAVSETEPKLVGVLAEFATPDEVVSAAARIRDAGYTRWDTYTPFPIHAMDEAMGIRRTILPWFVLAGGLTGVTVAIGMQWYMNASDWSANAFNWPWSGYQYAISGKPYWSLPANIPIAFELTVLLSAFAAFFGVLILNRLPLWYNPLFKIERFKKVTDNEFFLAIDAGDPKFDAIALPEELRGLGAHEVEECWDDEPRRVPRLLVIALVVFLALLLLPPVLVMKHRISPFTTPRLHPVTDMDFQAKFKSQQRNVFFDDQRAMRPQVEGTVARGSEMVGDARFHLGVEPGQAMASVKSDEGGVKGAEKADGSGNGAPPEDPPAGMNENQNWVETIPIPVNEELMARGRLEFGIYCAPCHGYDGSGKGIVNQRVLDMQPPQTTWLPVPSLHTQETRNRPDGYIFRAITEGVRKMPAYGDQIAPGDRWAIVLYLRALQRSQGVASPSQNEDEAAASEEESNGADAPKAN